MCKWPGTAKRGHGGNVHFLLWSPATGQLHPSYQWISPLCWRPSHVLNAQVGSCSLLTGEVKHTDSRERLPDPNIQTVGLPFTKSLDFGQMTDLLRASVSSSVMG